MKKTYLILAVILAGLIDCRATVTIQPGSAGWGDSTTASVNGMTWGIVVNGAGATFAGTAVADLSVALEGFSIPAFSTPSTPLQIGASDYYFINAQTLTSNSGPPTFTNGFMNSVTFNLTGVVGTGDAAGLLWFAEGTTTAGSHFGFQDLGQLVPADGATITTGWGGTPSLANNVIGVPEPSRLVFLAFGVLGIFLRRRRC